MLTRRRFSKSVAAFTSRTVAAGAALTGLRPTTAAAQGLGTDYDVIVVGAGLSGLVAAQRLSALVAEPKILILEARDRIGGRVWSDPLKAMGRDAELGALYLPDAPSAKGEWAPVTEFDLGFETLPGGFRTLTPAMGALTRALADKSLGTVQLNSPVSSVFFREGLVGVSYRNLNFESNVSTRRLVITVPPPVLLGGDLKIEPRLTDAKLRALRAASSENAISVAAVFPPEAASMTIAEDRWVVEESAVSYRAFRIGQQKEVLLEAQFRTSRAAALAGQSDETIAALALRGFKDILESVPQPAQASSLHVVNWGAEVFSGGARFDMPGTDAARVLAEPMQDTVFFAGDTTVPAPGVAGLKEAYESGVRVADEVARTLGVDVPDDEGEEALFVPF